MADIAASNWSETDASNNSAPPNGFPFGMLPSGENTGARAIMGAVKRWWNRMKPTTTDAGGTSTAYTLTYAIAPAAYVDGETFLVRFDKTNGAAPTLNVMSLGALPIYKYAGGAWGAVAAGDLPAGLICRLSYNQATGALLITSSSATAIGAAFLGIANTFTAAQTMSGAAFNEAQGTPIASATTTDIGAALGNYVHVTGTTTITGLGTIQAGTRRKVVFDGILTLTHNPTSLILFGANIATAAGDSAEFESEGSGNWRCTAYTPALAAPKVVAAVKWTAGGTSIVNSYNVMSIIRNGVGDYTVNVTNALPANAYWQVSMYSATTAIIVNMGPGAPSTTTAEVRSFDQTSALTDGTTYFAIAYA